MTFKGNLRDVPPADVLQVLLQNEKQGTLRIQGPDSTKHIYCSPEGITLLEPEILKKRRIGDIIVAAKLATREDVEYAAANMQEGQRLGEALAEAGIIHPDAIHHLLRIQIEEELLGIFDVKSGEFEFIEEEEDGEPHVREGLPLFQLDGVVIEAARRMDEWRYISENIKDFDMVFTRNPNVTFDEEPDAQRVLDCVDGRRTIRNISDGLLASPFEVAKIMARFVDKGYLRPLLKPELLALAQSLLEEGEIEAGGVILKKLRPNLKNIMVDDEEVGTLAELFYMVGDILTATTILMVKVREAKDANRIEDAIVLLQQAHRIAPEDTRILNELAATCGKLGDRESRVQYLIALAQIHLRAERFDQALQVCAEILETRPGESFVLESIPEYLVQAGNKQGAVDFLEGLVEKLGKKADLKQVAGIYRHILRINPTRKDISEKLNHIRNMISGGRRKLIHLAGFLIVLLGGVVSWMVNTGEEVSELDLVEQAALLLAGDRIQEAEDLMVQALATMKEVDARTAAENLLEIIKRRKKEADQWTEAVEQKKYQDRILKIEDMVKEAKFGKAVQELHDLAAEFPDMKYRQTTQKETRSIVDKIRKDLLDLRERIGSYEAPSLIEKVKDVYDEYKNALSREELDSIISLGQNLCPLLSVESFKGIVTEAFIDEVQSTALQGERFLEELDALKLELMRWEKYTELSDTYMKAQAAETNGRLDEARELYKKLSTGYKEGALKEEFEKKARELQEFRDAVDQVQADAEAGKVQEAYDRAMDLLERYQDQQQYKEWLKVPVRIETVPEGTLIRCQGLELGTTPKLKFLQADELLNVSLEHEGFSPVKHVISKEGGAIQKFTMNRKTFFTHPLGWGNLVLGKPHVEGDRLVVATSKGYCFLFNLKTGNPLGKKDSHSISGITSSVIKAHENLYFHTGEGKLYCFDAGAFSMKKDFELTGGTSTAPAAVPDGVLSACNDGTVTCFSPLLEKRWIFKHKGEVRVDPLVLEEAGHVIIAFSIGDLICIDLNTGLRVWEHSIVSGEVKGLAADESMLIICSSDGWVKALDLETRKELWKRELDYYINLPPLIDGDRVFVAARDHLVSIDRQHGQVLSDIPVGDVICTRLAVEDGFICFGTEDFKLHYRSIEIDMGKDIWAYYSNDFITSIPLITEDYVIVADHSGGLSVIMR